LVLSGTTVLVYGLGAMKYALASLANLLTLAIGIALGVMLSPHLEKPAHAFSAAPQATAPPVTTPLAATPNGPEQISPTMTVGSIGTYLLLAHHIQSDELVVNGIDVLKLEQGEINLLARTLGINPQDVQNIVNDAKVTHVYQVASLKQLPPANTQKR
jgi:hypothetical protein